MFRDMARKKQMLDDEAIREILESERRGVLSLHGEDGYPYGLPMNYLYDAVSGCIYFHSGRAGHKTDAIKADNRASFCVYDAGFRKEGEWSLNIKSVIVFGRINVVTDRERAREIYRALSRKFTSDTEYIESEIERFESATVCYELRAEHVSGKIVNES